MIPTRVTAHALRCMDKAGGLDEYILRTRDQDLKSVFALELKARLKAAKAAIDSDDGVERAVSAETSAARAR